ncbi:MAG: M35 family metallo-endopeptidase [Sandarakinorhabdus sp.]
MAEPYKDAHKLLVKSIGDPSSYASDWQSIAKGMKVLATETGFDPKGQSTPKDIRAKVAKAKSEADAFRAGANAPRGAIGTAAEAGNRRALALKTARHLYFHASFGRQKIWILDLPTWVRAFPIEYYPSDTATVDGILNHNEEMFKEKARKDLSTACQTGLKWIHAAMRVAGSPKSPASKKLFRRWFVPAGTPNEDAVIATFAAKLTPHLNRIAAGLKSGEVILTDNPRERGTGSDLEQSEAFVFTGGGDIITVYIEKDFFSAGNTLTGETNWARIIVHELSHSYANTEDHSYSWQGLLPRNSDMLKSANDKILAANADFKPVRSLTMAQCQENADSWAFFIADCAGALSESNRIAALGSRLYDLADESMNPLLQDKLQVRAR